MQVRICDGALATLLCEMHNTLCFEVCVLLKLAWQLVTYVTAICSACVLTGLLCLQDFVEGLEGIPDDAKQNLKHLTPASYIGNAAEQAKQIVARCKAIQ